MLHKLSLASIAFLLGGLALCPIRVSAQTATSDQSESSAALAKSQENRTTESAKAETLAIAPEKEPAAVPSSPRRSTMPCRIFSAPSMNQ